MIRNVIWVFYFSTQFSTNKNDNTNFRNKSSVKKTQLTHFSWTDIELRRRIADKNRSITDFLK